MRSHHNRFDYRPVRKNLLPTSFWRRTIFNSFFDALQKNSHSSSTTRLASCTVALSSRWMASTTLSIACRRARKQGTTSLTLKCSSLSILADVWMSIAIINQPKLFVDTLRLALASLGHSRLSKPHYALNIAETCMHTVLIAGRCSISDLCTIVRDFWLETSASFFKWGTYQKYRSPNRNLLAWLDFLSLS